MTITRTPIAEPETTFTVDVPITKSWVDQKTGQRHIVGVATGVAEDRDGERCSKSCVVGIGGQIEKGGVKITSSHQQDWMTEIGDVAKHEYDAETDELIITGVLPPEGVDPIADKAWRTANSEKVGWSIGGKLLKSYFERNEVGKKRKVLDAIALRHVALTKNPSYSRSFAQAVAKTWDGDTPADDAFTEEVAKDGSTGSWASGSSDSGGGNTGRDSVGSGQRNAGTRSPDAKGMNTEDDGSDDDSGKDLPKVSDERHLACPNCGHEFAADLPVDPDEKQVDDTNSDNHDDDEDGSDTGKSAESPLMTKLTETLDALKALADRDEVAKTDPEPTADAVEKTPTADGPSDVEKMVAASYQAHESRFADLEKSIGEGFELIAKSHQKLASLIADMPQGRKSTARVLPPATGHNGDAVEKTTDQLIEEAPDAASALKIANAAIYGVR